jgi:hypothetical protein
MIRQDYRGRGKRVGLRRIRNRKRVQLESSESVVLDFESIADGFP